MKNLKMYEPSDKMITLIKDNYSILQALGSFGINLGFGDKTVSETCEMNGVDTYTFLAVVNAQLNDITNYEDDEQISVPTLLHYLKASHLLFGFPITLHPSRTAGEHQRERPAGHSHYEDL